MIDEAAIEDALKSVLGSAALGYPVAWPNQDMPEPKPVPRLEFNLDRAATTNDDLAGGSAAAVSVGLVRVLVVVAKGVSTGAGNDLAGDVAALYPMGLRVPFTGGVAVMTGAPSIRAGFRNGSEWVIPVVTPYRAQPA